MLRAPSLIRRVLRLCFAESDDRCEEPQEREWRLREANKCRSSSRTDEVDTENFLTEVKNKSLETISNNPNIWQLLLCGSDKSKNRFVYPVHCDSFEPCWIDLVTIHYPYSVLSSD